jgi:hypothetical protein
MIYKDPDDGRQRFLLELEFVQCLANPTYIHCRFIKFFLFFHLSLAFIFVVLRVSVSCILSKVNNCGDLVGFCF